jgi:AcrR family transcriptional regulator
VPQFTKKAIIDSFIKLLNEKALDKITIKDIVEDCGINRNTFYYHFEDIHALVIHILSSETERVISQHQNVNSWEEGFIAAAKFALDNKRAVYHIYNSVSREELDRYLNGIAKDVMDRFVCKISAGIDAKEKDKELITNFYKCALVGMVLDWVSKGMKEDPEELIRNLGKLLEGDIATALKRSSGQHSDK